jgi:para-nitrobenzyl esterase
MNNLFLFLFLFTTPIMMLSAQSKKQPVVQISKGKLAGTLEPSGIKSYKGIPFAAPPVDDLRWKAPQPVKSWKGVKEAKNFGPRAMQLPIFGDMNFRSNGMSEDCLYLNVWTPANSPDEKIPVLVYFYGGGFVAGDGSEPRYDGESMAQKGIVALTVNYRLGIFGFYAHPELTEESPHQSSGNYGLLDQQAALQWVQDNIAAFGGDPKRVTIAGESVGSVSVSAQMASPLAKDLIAGAIGESGSMMGTLPPVLLQQAEQIGLRYAEAIGASGLAELRAIPAEELLNKKVEQGPGRFPLVIDGYFLPKAPVAIFEAGEQAQVPLLVGWNSAESSHRAILRDNEPNPENYRKAIKDLYGEKAEQVMALYPGNSEKEIVQSATDLAGDRFIGFSTWKWADLHSQTGDQPVFRYYYAHGRPPMVPEMGDAEAGMAGGVIRKSDSTAKKAAPAEPKPRAKGAVHSAEIEYAMGNLSTNKVFAWTEEDYKVSRMMQEYFANFIKTGNPNGKGLLQWPAATEGNAVKYLQIELEPEVKTEQNRERYLFLDGI